MSALAREDVTESFLKSVPAGIKQLEIIGPVRGFPHFSLNDVLQEIKLASGNCLTHAAPLIIKPEELVGFPY